MHPATLSELVKYRASTQFDENRDELLSILSGPHHFHLTGSILDVVQKILDPMLEQITSDNLIKFTDFRSPESSVLPAKSMVLTLDWNPQNTLVVVLANAEDFGVVGCLIRNGVSRQGFCWVPGEHGVRAGTKPEQEEVNLWLANMCMLTQLAISLINEPNLSTCKSFANSRQVRRQIEGATKNADVGYSQVSWTVGKPRIVQDNGMQTEIRMPLHWCRGHWRKEDHQTPKAQWVTPMYRPAGWYVWVKDCWKGHPDFGIRLQHHNPLIAGERAKSGGMIPSRGPSVERLAVMTEQARFAMLHAGFAA